MKALFVLIAVTAMLLCSGVAQAAPSVVFVNSDPVVAVHSNFRGQTVTLFGSVEAAPGEILDPLAVVVLVQGPSSDWVVREKSRQFGLVLNAASAGYSRIPGYYAILSSGPLAQIADAEVLSQQRFSLLGVAEAARAPGADAEFDQQLVRMMRQSGYFIEGERAVVMLSPTAFSVRVPLASDAPNGLYLARAFILSGGRVIADTTTRFTVRTQGFERYVAVAARTHPLLYGLAAIIIALATGWLGGVLFKR